MNQITYFYLPDCPFCAMADRAIDELIGENPAYAAIGIDRVDEEAHPEIVEHYAYYHVPCFYIGQDKVFEAYYMIPYEEVKAGVQATFDRAL